MADVEQLRAAVEDLAQVTHQLAHEVQTLAVHVERETPATARTPELPVIISELSELHQRLRKLAATTA